MADNPAKTKLEFSTKELAHITAALHLAKVSALRARTKYFTSGKKAIADAMDEDIRDIEHILEKLRQHVWS